MARKIISKSEIRNNFTKLVDGSGKYTPVSNWLPSIGGDFQNTFTLNGTNPIGGGSSKGEINRITNFNQQDTNDINLLRYTLFLYCTQKNPYFFDRSTYLTTYRPEDGLLFSQDAETFLKTYQTGQGDNPQTRSLTADIVRTYRGTKLKGNIEDENSVQSLINYSQIPNGDYQQNVAGVLGKVTYDSVVKHRLYADLLQSGYIPNLQKQDPTKTVSELATNLQIGEFGIYVDTAGGPASRAFPVICVYTKDIKNKKVSDFLEKANGIVESKFFRKLETDKQLVTPINSGKEKNFLEYQIRDSGYSAYCLVYDFTKVITLEPSAKNDYTLGILKICLSVLSRIQTNSPTTKEQGLTLGEFEKLYKKSATFLDNSFGDEVEELFFKILYPTKHTKETAYLTDKNQASLKPKISKSFKLEITNLANSIVSVGDKLINVFKEQVQQNFQFKDYSPDQEYRIFLHFDNFYNLLAVTTYNTKPKTKKNEIDEDSPFVLEDYKTEFSTSDLIAKFYDNPGTLPTFANDEYKFQSSFALQHDIVLITDFFIQEVYKNLDVSSPDFVYEAESNRSKDDVLTAKSFKLLNLINSRLNVNLNKNDYFFISSNKIYLKKEVVRKINLDEFSLLFKSVDEDKIKLQTVSYILRNLVPETKKLGIPDIVEAIYYPKLQETSPTIEKDQTTIPKETPPADPPKKNNYLINNIITSELACYEDIYKTFQDAINQEKFADILWGVSKSLFYAGLPFLLVYASDKIAAKLKEVAKKTDKNLLECVLTDSDDLKKLIIGSLDVIDNPKLLLQKVPKPPELPLIPAFPVFDLEKELKRRLVEYVLKVSLDLLSKKVLSSLSSLQDMCNSDSYLSSFLNNIVPNLASGEKLGTPGPSGLPVGVTSATYIPEINANINSLIEESGIESRENVYELFRINYFIDKETYSNQEISDFFDYLSSDIDSGELLVLIKGKSTPEIRNLVLTFVKGYKLTSSTDKNKFSILFENEKDIGFLFIFLGRYINYRILMEQIANSLNNYTPSVCIDVDSKFEDYSFKFGEDQTNAEAAELENILNDVCSLKKDISDTLDLISGGPSLLTATLSNALKTGFSSVVDSIENSKRQVTLKGVDNQGKVINKAAYEIVGISVENFAQSLLEDGIDISKPENKITYYNLLLTSDKEELNEIYANKKEIFLDAITKNINDNFNYRKEKYKQIFNDQLKSAGNIGLKTDPTIFSDYIEKYNSMKGSEAYNEIKQEQVLDISLQNFVLGTGSDGIGLKYFNYEEIESLAPVISSVGKEAAYFDLPKKYKDIYDKLLDLHTAMAYLGTDKDKIYNTIDNMNSEEKCWLCYRSKVYNNGSSMISAVQTELSGDDLDTFFNKLKCTDYGYKSIGNDGGPNNWKCKK